MRYLLLTASILFILFTSLFAQTTPDKPLPPDVPVAYTIFLIGDVGAPRLDIQEPTLALLQAQLEASDKASAVIFLGDNIYPRGLPDSAEKGRAVSEQSMLEQMKVTNHFPVRYFLFPATTTGPEAAAEAGTGWQTRKHL
jgi:hypothetical protein